MTADPAAPQAGPALDAELERKVFNRTVVGFMDGGDFTVPTVETSTMNRVMVMKGPCTCGGSPRPDHAHGHYLNCKGWDLAPEYSRDHVAALAVVERLVELGWDVAMDTPGKDQRWEVTLLHRTEETHPGFRRCLIRQADIFPLAVCKAALAAVEARL